MRLNMSFEGDPIIVPRRRRVPRVTRMLVMLDVSGSMERHVQLLLQLAYAVSADQARGGVRLQHQSNPRYEGAG